MSKELWNRIVIFLYLLQPTKTDGCEERLPWWFAMIQHGLLSTASKRHFAITWFRIMMWIYFGNIESRYWVIAAEIIVCFIVSEISYNVVSATRCHKNYHLSYIQIVSMTLFYTIWSSSSLKNFKIHLVLSWKFGWGLVGFCA